MSKKPKGWYKDIVIRPVVHVDGYESYEKICSFVADIYYSVEEQKLLYQIRINPTESRYITLYTLLKVGQAKCPAYWVNKDLLEALLQSVLTVEIDSINWAMRTGIFMLPKGVIFSPENNSVDAIFWNYDSEADILYWTATDGSSAFCRRFKLDAQKLYYTDSQDIDPKVVKGFNEYLHSIILRLILIMECRPEFIDTTSEKVMVNKGFGKAQAQDFYQPLWLGRGYKLKREGTQITEVNSRTHDTKSVNWRRGLLSNQPDAESPQQRKLVWIEPVLVMGGKES
ncbi:hypothetical protein ACN23B_30630 (plasmid) [Anabaena sp. FACHB-709]|uniref:Uncharacterized protein n=2 Tax=Nostocaceae TaxID=1162 RepID=A0A1Z4KWP6_ANAVA|nr:MULTISPECIES: hypothetical protein [Nostocaceae]BAY73461.1 hypothetical protein NIES23_63130 [Trichormus variabilis NIES-23]MBD2174614.1 hypothetical protein [Anabaena cylindrica FACHB-318]MBD2266335.1 hypothetical protein [Anabaena sp. FACHB-709]MBD2275787.1 hypothetical protein [Nostoc sp. PCC 7120 = FACHB-418]MBD2286965.1 hypothetical protein [Anabaena cylindrica FACHB-170]